MADTESVNMNGAGAMACAGAAVASRARNVYECVSAVSAELAKTGIAKNRKNQQQGYEFRGIDDVYLALAPLMAKHQLVMLPRIVSRECVERTAKSGAALFYVTVVGEFDLISTEDGSCHRVRTYGEAQDSGDKATNKAMSAAYKYAAIQTFCIPTSGDNDADATTPEPSVLAAPPGYDDWLADLEAVADTGIEALRDAWTASAPALRKHMTNTDSPRLRALKERAASHVTAHA